MERKSLRGRTWDDYGISKSRYMELRGFCLQYWEKKEQIQYGLTAINADGMPRSGKIGRPTEAAAIHNNKYLRDCELIERLAREASGELWPWILASVTEDLSYEELTYHQELGQIPVNHYDFYCIRRYFYSLLHQHHG